MGLLAVIQFIEWLHKPFTISFRHKIYICIASLIVAQFFVYQDIKADRTKVTEDQKKATEAFALEKIEAKRLLANREGQIESLKNQVQDQQSTINKALVQLGNAQQQEPLKITHYFLGAIPGRFNPEIAPYRGNFLVLTNKIITPVRLLVTCDGEIVQTAGNVLGTGAMMEGGWGGKGKNKNEYGIGILSPAWTPTNPLLVTLYTNQKQINCNFSQH
jgi:hypothetical protein